MRAISTIVAFSRLQPEVTETMKATAKAMSAYSQTFER